MLGHFPGKRALPPDFTGYLSYSSGEKGSQHLCPAQSWHSALTKEPTCTSQHWEWCFVIFTHISTVAQGLSRGTFATEWEIYFFFIQVTDTLMSSFFLSLYWNNSSYPSCFWVKSLPFRLYMLHYTHSPNTNSFPLLLFSLLLLLAVYLNQLFYFGCQKGTSIFRAGICHSELAQTEMKRRWNTVKELASTWRMGRNKRHVIQPVSMLNYEKSMKGKTASNISDIIKKLWWKVSWQFRYWFIYTELKWR